DVQFAEEFRDLEKKEVVTGEIELKTSVDIKPEELPEEMGETATPIEIETVKKVKKIKRKGSKSDQLVKDKEIDEKVDVEVAEEFSDQEKKEFVIGKIELKTSVEVKPEELPEEMGETTTPIEIETVKKVKKIKHKGSKSDQLVKDKEIDEKVDVQVAEEFSDLEKKEFVIGKIELKTSVEVKPEELSEAMSEKTTPIEIET